MEEKKQNEYLFGKEQVESILEQMKKEKSSERILKEVKAITPIFAVYLVTKSRKKEHFANFYGTTFNYEKGLTQSKIEADVKEKDAKIFGMINELEQLIKVGNFNKVKSDLYVEINWAQFGGFIHKNMAEMEDAISCSSVEDAFYLFKKQYETIGKTDKQILDKKLEDYKENLDAIDDVFDF